MREPADLIWSVNHVPPRKQEKDGRARDNGE